MPRPTPVKIAPLASPRRADGTCGSTAGAASTISTPPAKPEAKRQTKNHPKESGIAEAKKVAAASAIIARSTDGAERARAIACAASAPAR